MVGEPIPFGGTVSRNKVIAPLAHPREAACPSRARKFHLEPEDRAPRPRGFRFDAPVRQNGRNSTAFAISDGESRARRAGADKRPYLLISPLVGRAADRTRVDRTEIGSRRCRNTIVSTIRDPSFQRSLRLTLVYPFFLLFAFFVCSADNCSRAFIRSARLRRKFYSRFVANAGSVRLTNSTDRFASAFLARGATHRERKYKTARAVDVDRRSRCARTNERDAFIETRFSVNAVSRVDTSS